MNVLPLVLCILLPLLGAFRVTLIGEIGMGEPVLLIFLLFSFQRAKEVLSTPIARTVIFLGLLWFASQVATDLYRGTPFEDYSRGWAKISMLLLSYVGCFVLVGYDFRRMLAFAFGIMLAPALNYAAYGSDLPLYKFIFGAAVSFAAFVFIGFSRKPSAWLALVPGATGVLALMMGSRSLAGITFSAAAYYAMLSTGWIRQDVQAIRKLIFALVWSAIAYSSVLTYTYLANTGNLSDEALSKYEEQRGTSDNFNVLMGRSEVYYAVPKIMESPIVGFGSWAKDPDYVAKRSLEQGINPAVALAETGGLIPTHSHFFGGWLEAGIFGAIFWGYVLFVLSGVLLSGWLASVARWSGVCSFLLVLFAWDVVFSPFGGERRLNNGFYLWVVTFFALAIRHQKLQSWIAVKPGPLQFRKIRARERVT